MKTIDEYHKWVEWSEKDQVYIGQIHGDDPVQVYQELGEVVQEVIVHFQKTGRPLPAAKTRSMMEIT